MTAEHISPELARQIALHAQLLNVNAKLPSGKEGIAKAIEKLGYVQIDTISVVERAHHHTLWTRILNYKQEMLNELQSIDKRIFEYWGHAASYLPMNDYRYYIPKMRSFENPGVGWHKRLLEKYRYLTPEVLERISQEGPLSSKDFERPAGTKQGGWWDWKPAKTALELLFWQGKLMVTGRQGFQRVYDLTERVLPDWADTRYPDNQELGHFFVRHALRALGIAQEREIQIYIDGAERPILSESLACLLGSGEIVPVELLTNAKLSYYMLKNTFEESVDSWKFEPQVYILSPFDNLIIQRGRTQRLFEFDYSIECYLPSEKRIHGYFVLPILWGDRFVARMDVKADRSNKTLIVHSLNFEPGFKEFERFLSQFLQKLTEYAHFNQCLNVEIENTQPAKMKTVLMKKIVM